MGLSIEIPGGTRFEEIHNIGPVLSNNINYIPNAFETSGSFRSKEVACCELGVLSFVIPHSLPIPVEENDISIPTVFSNTNFLLTMQILIPNPETLEARSSIRC